MNLEDATKVWHVITFEEHSMARSARSLLYGLAFESFRVYVSHAVRAARIRV